MRNRSTEEQKETMKRVDEQVGEPGPCPGRSVTQDSKAPVPSSVALTPLALTPARWTSYLCVSSSAHCRSTCLRRWTTPWHPIWHRTATGASLPRGTPTLRLTRCPAQPSRATFTRILCAEQMATQCVLLPHRCVGAQPSQRGRSDLLSTSGALCGPQRRSYTILDLEIGTLKGHFEALVPGTCWWSAAILHRL